MIPERSGIQLRIKKSIIKLLTQSNHCSVATTANFLVHVYAREPLKTFNPSNCQHFTWKFKKCKMELLPKIIWSDFYDRNFIVKFCCASLLSSSDFCRPSSSLMEFVNADFSQNALRILFSDQQCNMTWGSKSHPPLKLQTGNRPSFRIDFQWC